MFDPKETGLRLALLPHLFSALYHPPFLPQYWERLNHVYLGCPSASGSCQLIFLAKNTA